MSDLPVIGAAMTIATYETHYDFMRELPRDIEIQDFFDASLLNGDWASFAAHARKLLDGHEGRIGIHGPFWGFNIASQDPDVRAIVTHAGEERCIRDTLERLAGSDSLLGTPMVMHILD